MTPNNPYTKKGQRERKRKKRKKALMAEKHKLLFPSLPKELHSVEFLGERACGFKKEEQFHFKSLSYLNIFSGSFPCRVKPEPPCAPGWTASGLRPAHAGSQHSPPGPGARSCPLFSWWFGCLGCPCPILFGIFFKTILKGTFCVKLLQTYPSE